MTDFEKSTSKPTPNYWRMRPRAPMPGTYLCELHEIEDPGAKEFIFGKGTTTFSMFVICKEDQYFGYLNICPHYSTALNYRGEEFMNDAKDRIRCSMHFAEFRIEDGFGVAGAAENCWLDPIPLLIKDDCLFIGQSD